MNPCIKKNMFLFITLSSCMPNNPREDPSKKVLNQSRLHSSSSNLQGETAETQDPEDANNVSFDPNASVQTFRKESNPKSWNKQKQEPTNAEDKGKKIQVLRVPFYKIIWMNLSQKTWADTVNNWLGRKIGDPLSQAGLLVESRPSFKEPDRIGIFQPMAPLRKEAIESGFRVLGHTVQPNLDIPTYPTAIFAYMSDAQDKTLFVEPEDYQLVYSQGAFGYAELYNKCMSPSAQMKVYVETNLQEECKQYMPEIFGNIDNINQKGYQLDPNSEPNRWKNWFTVLSTAVWKPIPPEGYGCLGYFATNGDLNKPAIESAQDPQAGPSTSEEMGQAYCLKEELLSEGTIGEQIGQTNDQKVTFFKIKAKNPQDGYDSTNFFYAKTASSKPDEKIWVVKKSILKIIDDEKMP